MTLSESDFRARYGLVILSVIRDDRTILHNPPANMVFAANDILVVLGSPSQVQTLTGIKPLVTRADLVP
jgi:Trk K+ transport system NAD-binding subunit